MREGSYDISMEIEGSACLSLRFMSRSRRPLTATLSLGCHSQKSILTRSELLKFFWIQHVNISLILMMKFNLLFLKRGFSGGSLKITLCPYLASQTSYWPLSKSIQASLLYVWLWCHNRMYWMTVQHSSVRAPSAQAMYILIGWLGY